MLLLFDHMFLFKFDFGFVFLLFGHLFLFKFDFGAVFWVCRGGGGWLKLVFCLGMGWFLVLMCWV